MKIAISATGKSLDAEVDPRFGRCQYFVIADTDTGGFEALDNSSAAAAGGAGISAAQTVVAKGIGAVLTGNCGPNAHQVFSAAGVKVITGVSGKIKDAIAEYKLGTYSSAQQANVPDHYGMGGGRGMGMGGGGGGRGRGMGGGGGGGRGRGMGMGRGMGGGMGMGGNNPPAPDTTKQSLSPEQEMEDLKTQSQALANQLTEIQRRIDELGKK